MSNKTYLFIIKNTTASSIIPIRTPRATPSPMTISMPKNRQYIWLVWFKTPLTIKWMVIPPNFSRARGKVRNGRLDLLIIHLYIYYSKVGRLQWVSVTSLILYFWLYMLTLWYDVLADQMKKLVLFSKRYCLTGFRQYISCTILIINVYNYS